jgi:rod shape-determining protein MreC
MAKKQARVSEQMLLTWGMLAGLIFLFTPQSLTGKFQFAYARIFRVPLGLGRGLMLSANAHQPLAEEMVSRRKYNQLQNHLANVTQWLRQERQKVETLSGLRDRSVWQGVNFVVADVIAAPDSSHEKLIINRGGNDGLAEGQFVLGDYSIIGTITSADSRAAQVTLFTDPTSKIAVKIAELDVGAIMQGSGKKVANIRMLSRRHKINIGDVVYAQKKPGLLGTAMIVGTVDQCKADDENPLLWDVTVKPACDIERLDNVAVIVMNPI